MLRHLSRSLRSAAPLAKAFSLAELMIALAVLGAISALTLPGVLSNAKNDMMKAKGKEVVTQLQSALQANWQSGEEASYFTYLEKHLNVAQVCPGGETSGPCFGGWSGRYGHYRKIVLTNGSLLYFSSQGVTPTYSHASMLLDLNGAAGPNQTGKNKDLMCLHFNHGHTPWPSNLITNPLIGVDLYQKEVPPGQLSPCNWYQMYIDWWNEVTLN
jgi:prepilin-type N-terminal cleavage/methylation domain-containing protein